MLFSKQEQINEIHDIGTFLDKPGLARSFVSQTKTLIETLKNGGILDEPSLVALAKKKGCSVIDLIWLQSFASEIGNNAPRLPQRFHEILDTIGKEIYSTLRQLLRLRQVGQDRNGVKNAILSICNYDIFWRTIRSNHIERAKKNTLVNNLWNQFKSIYRPIKTFIDEKINLVYMNEFRNRDFKKDLIKIGFPLNGKAKSMLQWVIDHMAWLQEAPEREPERQYKMKHFIMDVALFLYDMKDRKIRKFFRPHIEDVTDVFNYLYTENDSVYEGMSAASM